MYKMYLCIDPNGMFTCPSVISNATRFTEDIVYYTNRIAAMKDILNIFDLLASKSVPTSSKCKAVIKDLHVFNRNVLPNLLENYTSFIVNVEHCGDIIISLQLVKVKEEIFPYGRRYTPIGERQHFLGTADDISRDLHKRSAPPNLTTERAMELLNAFIACELIGNNSRTVIRRLFNLGFTEEELTACFRFDPDDVNYVLQTSKEEE